MHMAHRMGNAVTAILVGALASVTLAVAANGMARAADNCLSGPKGAAPTGSHWYYRVDRAAKKNCWYVRSETPPASRNSSVVEASPQTETPLQPSVANARAEASPADFGQPNGAAMEAAPPPLADAAQRPDASAADAQSTVSSRWLNQTGADAANTAAPAPVDSGARLNSSTASVAAPLAAEVRPASPSVPPLLLVIVGALATAALLAGVTRFVAARRNDRDDVDRDQRAPWDSIDPGTTIRSPPLASEARTPQTALARQRNDAVIPDEIVQLLSKLSKGAAA
jgi:hypothetical protein